jgi:hypothetical protein
MLSSLYVCIIPAEREREGVFFSSPLFFFVLSCSHVPCRCRCRSSFSIIPGSPAGWTRCSSRNVMCCIPITIKRTLSYRLVGIPRGRGEMIGSERERDREGGREKKRKRKIKYALVGRCASPRIDRVRISCGCVYGIGTLSLRYLISRLGVCGMRRTDRHRMSSRLRYSLVSCGDSELAGWCASWLAAAATAAAGLLGVVAWWGDGWDHVCLEKRARGMSEGLECGVEWRGRHGCCFALSWLCLCLCCLVESWGESGMHLFPVDSTWRWFGIWRVKANHNQSVSQSGAVSHFSHHQCTRLEKMQRTRNLSTPRFDLNCGPARRGNRSYQHQHQHQEYTR